MQEIRRESDDELCGFIAEVDGRWNALTIFGAPLARGLDRAGAEDLVLTDGLASLSERWHYRASPKDDWQTVVIVEANPRSVTLALGYYSMPGVETLTLSSEQIISDGLLVREPPRPDPAVVRPFREGDGPATLDLFHRAIRQTAARDYSPEQVAAWAASNADVTLWTARRASARTFVAQLDSDVAGFTDVDDTGYVDMLYVDPRFARRRVATALLEHVLTWAQEHGVRAMSADVSITARPLFERFGFVVVREQHPVRNGVELTNFHMHMTLP